MEKELEKTGSLLKTELQKWDQISFSDHPEKISILLDQLIKLIQDRRAHISKGAIEIDRALGRLGSVEEEDLGSMRIAFRSTKKADQERYKADVAKVVRSVQREIEDLIQD